MTDSRHRPAPSQTGPRPLSGRVALVTGAGRGIGRSIAVQLAETGAAVLVVARSQSEINTTAQIIYQAGGAAAALRADVSDLEGLASLARAASQQFGTVDILVNNAATVQPLGTTATLDQSEVAAAVALNVLAPLALTAELLPAMQAGGWGRIVNVSSGIVARPQFMVGGNIYAATKSALEAHTLNLAAELAGTGVTANVYRPGSVDTAMQASIRSHRSDTGPPPPWSTSFGEHSPMAPSPPRTSPPPHCWLVWSAVTTGRSGTSTSADQPHRHLTRPPHHHQRYPSQKEHFS